MKLFLLILLIIVIIKCEGFCDFDNKTIELVWKKEYRFQKTFPFDDLLYYHKLKWEFVNDLNLNNSKLHCEIENICNTRFYKVERRYEEYSNFEKSNDYTIRFGYKYVYDYNYDYESDYYTYLLRESEPDYEEYSFCELYFMFEHKTKFVFLIDHLEVWLFAHRNFTIHSSQFSNKSAKLLLNKR